MATLVFSIEDLNDIIKIVKSLEESGLLLNWLNETVENELKEQKGWFLSVLPATLGPSLFGNMLADDGVIRVAEVVIRADWVDDF